MTTNPVSVPASVLTCASLLCISLIAEAAEPNIASYGSIPLHFEANRGQADQSIDYVARGPGYTVALQAKRASFQLRSGEKTSVLRMRIIGGNGGADAEGAEELEGKVNYFIGSDPEQWRQDVPTYGRVRYRQVYRGIDLVYYGNQRQLEYDFVVAPGADWRKIRLAFEGAEKVELDAATGDLLLHVGGEIVRQAKPIVYQEVNGERRVIDGSYSLRKNNGVGFAIGEYDGTRPLVIDPTLVYSTYLGGSSTDLARAIAVDSSGNALVTGYTTSGNFPTANALQAAPSPTPASFGTRDVFVTKINAAGTAFVYSTYLGGSGGEEARGIAVDASGNAYVAGFTSSTNFPIANAVQASMGGTQDAFVTKLNPAGSALVYSTYLGGAGNNDGSNSSEFGEAIAVDAAGNAYVTGSTFSENFPTANAIQGSFGGGSTDAFVTKINATGDAFVYSTYLGGSGMPSSTQPETGKGIAADSAGNAYITGETNSANDFPLANAIQAAFGGGISDAFVTKINAGGTAFIYSTYLGGGAQDAGEGVKADASGNAYVAGFTVSDNFPRANALQGTFGGVQDAFVTKLNPAGSALIFSTYLGGTGGEIAFGIAIDASDSVSIGGSTGSFDTFPVRNANQCARNGGQDLFIAKFNPAATELIYSTYIGGSGSDSGEGIALDASNNAYMTGSTTSTDFPTVNPIQAMSGGGSPFGDAFVIKFNDALPPNACATPTPAPTPTPTVTPTPTATPTPTPEPTPEPTPPPPQLLNISTRLRVGTGSDALIGGFIITGNEAKKVIIRAIGPSLAEQGVAGVLEDPTLELFDNAGEPIAFNNNWKDEQQDEIEESTIPPGNDAEAAIVRTLPPGNYTAIVRGSGDTTGIGLVEIYDLSASTQTKLANISSRGFVDLGENVLIGGFIVRGEAGTTRVVLRAVGPSLGNQGVEGALQDPVLQLVDANGSEIAANDDWKAGSQQAELESLGLGPTNELESALIATLGNGNYTAIVSGQSDSTGVGLVEVYNVP